VTRRARAASSGDPRTSANPGQLAAPREHKAQRRMHRRPPGVAIVEVEQGHHPGRGKLVRTSAVVGCMAAGWSSIIVSVAAGRRNCGQLDRPTARMDFVCAEMLGSLWVVGIGLCRDTVDR